MGAPLQPQRFIQQQPQRHRPPPSQAHWYQPMQPPSHHHQSINSSSPYPTLQPNPYHAQPPQHYNNNHFQMLPPRPPHHHHHHHLYSHPSQSYTPQSNNHQTWENGWVHHQGWEHPDRNMSNNGDWAGWAREWAMENQHLPSQFTHIGRLDGHNNAYHDQYEHIVDPRYTDTRQPMLPSSTHQQFSVPLANPHRPPLNYMRDSIPFISGQSCSYVSDGSYTTLAADSNGVLPHQGSIPMNSCDNQHEVPPSYSSVPGNVEVVDQTEMLQNPSHLPLSSAQEQQNRVQSTLSAHPRSISAEQPQFTCEHQSNEFMTDPSDRPLEFAPGFRSDNCMHTDPAESAGSVDPGHASDRPLEFAPGFRGDNCMHTDPAESARSVDPGHASEYANGHYNVSESPEKDDKAASIREIKRILTDVLSKATDELFDEIATRVIEEDGMAVEVDHGIMPPNHKVSPSPSAIPTHKASAEVQSPVEDKKIEAKGNGGKSSSGFPGDVLGLATYASDDDEHCEAIETGSSQAEIKGPSGGLTNVERDHNITVPGDALHNLSTMDKGLSDNGVDKDFKCEKGSLPATEDTVNVSGGKMVEARTYFVSKDVIGEKIYMNSELSRRDVNYTKSMEDGTRGRETRRKSDKNDDKDFVKEAEAAKIKAAEKHSGSSEHRGRDERHVRKEKTDDSNGLQERVKHKDTKSRGKANESDSRKNYSSKDDIRETEKVTKAGTKDDSSRKRERVKDEKEDRSRKIDARNSSKHKRHRSSSVDSRGRNSKDNSVGNQANESSDEASKESTKRNRHSRKRSLSPRPTKSRRRGRESRSKSPDLQRR